MKPLTLNTGNPSFLSVTPGSDPINDDMTIAINTGAVTIADAQTYTISYTVAFSNDPSALQITGSFTLKLIDACSGATVNPQTLTFPD